FGMVAHGLITGMLFFVAGSVKERYHTLEIARLRGMLTQLPKLGWILGFCAMASLGLPGLAGFWGEFPAILSAWNPAEGLSLGLFRTVTVIAALGTVLAAAYLLWLYQRTAFGTPNPEFAGSDSHGGHDGHGDGHGHDDGHGHGLHDVNRFEWTAWIPLLVAIVVFGVYPQLMFKVMDPAVTAIFGK
ncbi:MAG: proton-conducting transporter membrane subunit, partial [Ilumatobacteraceae bacterium]